MIEKNSKRFERIQELKKHHEWATKNEDCYLTPPTEKAMISTESIISHLMDSCLNFKLAVSHNGEINLFYEEKNNLFQILIDDLGFVSFYGMVGNEEVQGSDKLFSELPYLKIVEFLELNK